MSWFYFPKYKCRTPCVSRWVGRRTRETDGASGLALLFQQAVLAQQLNWKNHSPNVPGRTPRSSSPTLSKLTLRASLRFTTFSLMGQTKRTHVNLPWSPRWESSPDESCQFTPPSLRPQVTLDHPQVRKRKAFALRSSVMTSSSLMLPQLCWPGVQDTHT